MDGYDTRNLRNDNFFSTAISRGLFWVSCNTLGQTRFTNNEIKQLFQDCTPAQIQKLRLNVYEAVQLFQAAEFKESDDIVFFHEEQKPWQLHKSGKYAMETNAGCCASAAAWFNYVTAQTYDQRGYVHYLRPDGSGHVINYVMVEGKYYLVDLGAQTNENAKLLPPETGLLADYISSIYFTGVCFCTEDLMAFVKYHARIQKVKGFIFSYYQMPAEPCLAACYTQFVEEELHFHFAGELKVLIPGDVILTQHDSLILDDKHIRYTNLYT